MQVEPNPYAPPASPPELSTTERASDVRLFGTTAIILHSVLLHPLVGTVLAATNYRRVRDLRGMRRVLLLFGPLGAGLLALSMAAPGTQLVFLGGNIGLAYALLHDQRPLLRRHFAAGGRRARWYVATLIAVVIMVLFIAIWQVLAPNSSA